MKFNINSLLRGAQWRRIHERLRYNLSQFLRALFIDYSHAVDVVAVLFVLGVGLYLIIVLLYIPPSGIDIAEPDALKLKTATLDRLIAWISQREVAGRDEFTLPAGDLFP